jgi:hypothetical protein
MFARKLQYWALVSTLAVGLAPARAEWSREGIEALNQCIKNAQADLAQSNLPKDEPLAILPVCGDSNSRVRNLLKIAATDAGLRVVEEKNDPIVAELVSEAEWDERTGNWLNPKTHAGIFNPEKLTQFGELMAAKMLMYAYVREVSGGAGQGYAEVEVHVTSIVTKQHLWGRTFPWRFYSGPEVTGLTGLEPELRKALKDSFDQCLPKLQADANLKGIRSVAVVPLSCDVQGYTTDLAKSLLSRAQLHPKENLNFQTRGEAQTMLRNDQQVADALLYGAVRDLKMRKRGSYPNRTEYDIFTSVQLTIQSTRTGELLWAQTLEGRGERVVPVTWWEMLKTYGPSVLARKSYVYIPLLVLVGLLVLAMFFRAMRRAR